MLQASAVRRGSLVTSAVASHRGIAGVPPLKRHKPAVASAAAHAPEKALADGSAERAGAGLPGGDVNARLEKSRQLAPERRDAGSAQPGSGPGQKQRAAVRDPYSFPDTQNVSVDDHGRSQGARAGHAHVRILQRPPASVKGLAGSTLRTSKAAAPPPDDGSIPNTAGQSPEAQKQCAAPKQAQVRRQRPCEDVTFTRPKRSIRQPARFKDFQQGTLRSTPGDSPAEQQGDMPDEDVPDAGAAGEHDQAQPLRKRRLVRLSHLPEAPQQQLQDDAAERAHAHEATGGVVEESRPESRDSEVAAGSAEAGDSDGAPAESASLEAVVSAL